MLGLLSIQENIPETGLELLVISGGDAHLAEPLDESILQQLANRCLNIKKFRVNGVTKMPDQVRVQMANFVASLLAS